MLADAFSISTLAPPEGWLNLYYISSRGVTLALWGISLIFVAF